MEKDVRKRAVAALSATLALYEEMDKERERRVDVLERRIAALEATLADKDMSREEEKINGC